MARQGHVHPSAIIEPGVEIGPGTQVWDNVHIRGPARVGAGCTIGEKSYLAYGVVIGDRVKINAFVYLCSGVTIEDGVMLSAGTVFTNDRYPRATTPDLTALRPAEPDEHTLATTVRLGATIGARAVVGPGLEIGRFAMIGMGAVVTRSVADFHLVAGHPARTVAAVCRCGAPVVRVDADDQTLPDGDIACPVCDRSYCIRAGLVTEAAV